MSKSDFYNFPPSWDPGYEIPDYVMAEPPGRGTFTTKWLPRGTINSLEPSFVADPGKKLLGRTDAGLGSLSGSSLAGSVLDEDTLGAQVYDLVPTGGPVDFVKGQSTATKALMVAGVVGVGALAYLTLRKRGRK